MANISDIIEEFILSTFGDDDLLQLSRNELANFFSCAPSQINYVLSTRFTPDKGYIVESKRGGGGCIKLIRLNENHEGLLRRLYDDIGAIQVLTANKVANILCRLVNESLITESESKLLMTSMSDKSLSFPVNVAGKLRAQMMREILLELAKREVVV